VTLDSSLGGVVPAGATFTVYAATAAPTAATSGTTKCADASGSKVIEEKIAVSGGSDSLTMHSLDTTNLVTAIAAACSDTDTDKEIFVCVQLFDASSPSVGIATGKVTLTRSPALHQPVGAVRYEALNGVGGAHDRPLTANYEVIELAADPNSPHCRGSSVSTSRSVSMAS
jgi:hypothetical protein